MLLKVTERTRIFPDGATTARERVGGAADPEIKATYLDLEARRLKLARNSFLSSGLIGSSKTPPPTDIGLYPLRRLCQRHGEARFAR